ncbi:MAG: CoA pyrophosphatase [Myxococcota bacterium]
MTGVRPRWAAVAVAVDRTRAEPHLLLVRRAARSGDPWSGDWAFPGGFGQADDPDPEVTARRETREEVGLVLGAATATLPRRWIVDPWRRRWVALVPVVFDAVEAALHPDPAEIADARWVPRSALSTVQREWLRIRGSIPWWARVRRFDGGRVWGLTGAILDDWSAGA